MRSRLNEKLDGSRVQEARQRLTRNDRTVTGVDETENEASQLAKQFGVIILMLTLLTIIALCMSALYIFDRCR